MDTKRVKQDYFYMAELAEQCECFQDMFDFIINGIKIDPLIDVYQRNLFLLCLKNISRKFLIQYKKSRLLQQKLNHQNSETCKQLIKSYKKDFKTRILYFSDKVIDLIDNHLLKFSPHIELIISFHKIKAGHWERLLEIIDGQDKEKTLNEAEKSYCQGSEISENHLEMSHPLRLEIILSFLLFFMIIKDDWNKLQSWPNKQLIKLRNKLQKLRIQ